MRRLLLAVTATALAAGCSTAPIARAQDEAPAEPATETAQAAPQTPEVGDTAPNFELTDIGGAQVKLSEIAAQGPVVLVMLRGYPGYQCPLCTAQVGQLINKAARFADAKANVLLVYPGPADGLKAHAAEFVRGKDMPENFHLLLDPDYKFTNLYNLRWDDPGETSYPSTFVLDGERKVLFAKVSHTHGDRAKTDEILAALPQ